MSEKLALPCVKTTPLAFGICVEFQWPRPILGTSELEIQCLFDDGRLDKRKIKFPQDVVLIRGLKAGECVQVRLRAIDEDGSKDEWDSHHWVKGQASSDAAVTLKSILEKLPFSIPAGSLTALEPSPYYREAGALLSSVDFEKETLSKALPEILKNISPNQMVSAAGIAAEAIKKAFSQLDKDSAGQS